MPAPDLDLRHQWGGGLATDLGSVAEVEPRGRIELPYLLTIDNAYFTFNGSVRKAGGTSKWNSSVIESGEEIRGMIEYVRAGTLGSPARRRVCFAGTKVLSDNNDGTFVAIKTGLQDDAIPNFTVFTDTLILANNASDVPMKWDQTTFANLGGSPPNFAFSVAHVNRLWAAGVAAFPSRLYYSAQLNAEDWSSSDAGHIDIEPDDGDVITGLIAHRGVLFVFKGPNFGSIHVISGRTPGDFARDMFSGEVGAVGCNMIFKFGNDVGFMALDGSVRSLSATDKYGNFEEATLSRPISTWMRDHMNSTAIAEGWAVTDPTFGYVLFTVPIYGSTKPNSVLIMDYRFGEPRWATWTAFEAYSVARMSDPTGNNRPILYLGGNDGYIRKSQQGTRLLDGVNTYRFFVQTPYLHYGTQNRDKTIKAAGISFEVRGTSTVELTLRASHGPIQSLTFDATAGARLDVEFTLDVSTLSGTQYTTQWNTDIELGQFREVSYELESFEGDVEIHTLHIVPEESQNPNYDNE